MESGFIDEEYIISDYGLEGYQVNLAGRAIPVSSMAVSADSLQLSVPVESQEFVIANLNARGIKFDTSILDEAAVEVSINLPETECVLRTVFSNIQELFADDNWHKAVNKTIAARAKICGDHSIDDLKERVFTFTPKSVMQEPDMAPAVVSAKQQHDSLVFEPGVDVNYKKDANGSKPQDGSLFSLPPKDIDELFEGVFMAGVKDSHKYVDRNSLFGAADSADYNNPFSLDDVFGIGL